MTLRAVDLLKKQEELKRLRKEYLDFLKRKGLEANPSSANRFAMFYCRGGTYRGMTEKQIILELEGMLPLGYKDWSPRQ